ncbi:adenylyl-sulfate kinase [Phaeocystidibacter luteus]|uniref:Adenylyl-sulfate kinase n=1 Tax=Phaeocystidibacter luteus TaxID=911197 RepID=A0A6N6RLD1_9FLAO|nr:adenylyl-sulfate kinase [Phaeocystidibacter luteus]KAB2814370.1 adenylyl-sulfate kinase [Phaeocystidibacter luteus]
MSKVIVIPQVHDIDREMREKLNGHKAKVLWFTGLSGSGKSTVANAVEKVLHARGLRTYILDGDNVRRGLNNDLDFSASGREENIRRIGEVANLMVDAGLIVLTAFVSPFKSDRDKVRKTVGTENFIEVFVDCPLEVCEQRDVKGLYKKARAGEIPDFTGITSPFEAPENPEIHLHTDVQSLEESVTDVLNYLNKSN